MKLIMVLLLLSGLVLGSKAQATANPESENLESVVSEPEGCLVSHKFPCAFRTTKSFKFTVRDIALHLGAGTSIVVQGARKIVFLEGSFWAQSSEVFHVFMGGLSLDVQGDFWVQSDLNKWQIKNLFAENLTVNLNQQGLKEVVPIGFENWFSKVGADLEKGRGVIRSIDMMVFIPVWNKTVLLEKQQRYTKVAQYKKEWKRAISEGSDFYQEVINRRIASQELEEQNKKKKLVQEKKEQQKLKMLFRQKNHLDELFTSGQDQNPDAE